MRSWLCIQVSMLAVACGFATVAMPLPATATATAGTVPWYRPAIVVAQAMVPPTGMMDASHPMPMQERMRRRFPQPVRVGTLIGLPVLDDRASTIATVRQVVRTPQDRIELIVSYGGLFGWGARRVAVPIEVVGIEGRQLVSLDMPPKAYAAAPTWHRGDAAILANDATVSVALARN